jgi:hypothetical protein
MRRLATVALLVFMAVAADAGARERCVSSERGQRFQASAPLVVRDRDVVGSRVVVCDRRTGRRFVVRHAVRRSGVSVEAAAAAGRRVAWIERHRRAGPRIEVVVLELPSRRELRRLVVARGQIRGLRSIDVTLTSHGDLAWLVPAGARGHRIVVRRAGGARREIARERSLWGLEVEDDRTLRWRRGRFDDFAYHDLRAPRMAGGCPRRKRFRRMYSDADVLVTSAGYGAPSPIDGESWTVLRACLRAVGRDFVVAQDSGTSAAWSATQVIRAAAPYLVLARRVGSRYDRCLNTQLQTVDLRSGRVPYFSAIPCGDEPYDTTPLAITGSGAPAWIIDRPDGARLLAIDGDRGLLELDRGVPGSLGALRAEAGTVYWSHAGALRSAKLS